MTRFPLIRLLLQFPLDSFGKTAYNTSSGIYNETVLAIAGGGLNVSEVRIKDNESLDNALKRFKRNCAKAGIHSDLRKHEHYESPSVKRRKKSEAARAKKKKFRF